MRTRKGKGSQPTDRDKSLVSYWLEAGLVRWLEAESDRDNISVSMIVTKSIRMMKHFLETEK